VREGTNFSNVRNSSFLGDPGAKIVLKKAPMSHFFFLSNFRRQG
jgi:hypothetical protein